MEIVILAAGKGTRMNSDLPKVLHRIGGKPMLAHVIETAQALGASKTHVVIGYGAEEVKAEFETHPAADRLNWVLQSEQLGTGHAVQQAIGDINTTDEANTVLIMYGDVPLTPTSTLQPLLDACEQSGLGVLTMEMEQPHGFGRILRSEDGGVAAIVEERDASPEQKAIKEVNSGIMAANATKLANWLSRISNNNDQEEYYLTDIVALANDDDCNVIAVKAANGQELMGVNDKAQLAEAEQFQQQTLINKMLVEGITMLDPSRVSIRGDVTFGKDVVLDSDVILEGSVSLGDGVRIGSNCILKNAEIKAGAHILPGTNIEGAIVGERAQVGPSARLRPGTELGEDCKIGNFVEVKNSRLGKGSKANHLAYIGDAEIGQGCNIGAGTIFCNYDGANKHKCSLGDNVFIGSNAVLVAPVTLADNSFVAAGSAINTDVPQDHLAVARGKQRNIDGWKRPVKKP